MNLCRGGCGLDFGSIAAFDRHRIGRHDFTYSEGAKMDPPREDGRRCLTVSEVQTLTRGGYAALVGNTPPQRGTSEVMFALNDRGAYSLTEDLEKARKIREAA